MYKTSAAALIRPAREAAEELPALMAAARSAANGILPGGHERRRPGMGEAFWQFRDYQTGDRPQDIDWRQSARGAEVVVRQKERQTSQTVLFWVDDTPGMEFASAWAPHSKGRRARILALALGLLLTRGHENAGLLDGSVRPGRSESVIEDIGRHLCRHGGALPLEALSVPRPARDLTLVLISDFLDPPEVLRPALQRLAGQCDRGHLIQVLDPAEIDLPWTGRVIFTPPGRGAFFPVTRIEDVREDYRKRILDHCEAVARLARDLGWHAQLHATDMPARDALLAFARNPDPAQARSR